jgi:hypothetical protein
MRAKKRAASGSKEIQEKRTSMKPTEDKIRVAPN